MRRDEPEPKGWTPVQDAQNAASLLVLLAQALAAPVEPILRSRFGSRYFGLPSLLGFLAVPMWMLAWPGEDPGPLLTFWALAIAMQLVARVQAFRMMVRGDIVHSRFNGYPRLARVLKRTPQHRINAAVEPWLVMGVGVLLLAVSEPLGSFLMASGASLAIVAGVIEAAQRRRALSMHDAWLEQQELAERFREITDWRR